MRRLLPSLLLLTILGGLSPAALAGKKPNNEQSTTHTVYRGQTLGRIAKRYNVSVDALCTANGITPRSPIKPGQKLVVPARDDKTGDRARAAASNQKAPAKATDQKRAASSPKDAAPSPAAARQAEAALAARARTKAQIWKKYARPARRAGYVVLKATGREWKGYAVVRGNRLSGPAHRGFRHVMYSWRTGAEAAIDPRLMRLLVRVSDTFGGRTIRIASGFREHSFAKESKHKLGRACDFSVDGVPNDALHEYLLTLDQVGVGYYPNSSFVHLDVRPRNSQWVDRAGPGEAPQYAQQASAK